MQTPGSAGTHDCFAHPDVAELTIEWRRGDHVALLGANSATLINEHHTYGQFGNCQDFAGAGAPT